MKRLRILPMLLMAVASVAAYAENSDCTVCHGASGQGNIAIMAPALTGIEPWFLSDALAAYRTGQRGTDGGKDAPGLEMRGVAREIGAAEFGAINSYLATLQPLPAQLRVVQGNARQGKRLYATHCSACHGPAAAGNETLHAPSLTRLNDWYLVASFRKYQQGLRGADTSAIWANQMHLTARSLPADFAIEDVADYIRTLRAARTPR